MARRQPRYYKKQGNAVAALPITYGFRDGALITFQLKARLALDAFRRGNTTLDDVAAIDTVLAVGLLLATDKTAAVADTIEQARRVLLEVASLMQQVLEISPTDEQFMQLADGLSYGEALLEAGTRRQVRDAVAEALRSSKRNGVGAR
ncbi:hypothetical protein [Cupriavidus sp. CuC1]|uniref:hypothetical protein n=1 Tax=Cupriavidus sp. CuC1 TaxID=3373131 RepID=UPI0037D7E5A2